MSTDVLAPPPPPPAPAPAPAKRKKRRRRFRFSLNGLAIQLSAFALSFTLVALLVVSGSQAAFVEENETVTDYVPIGTTEPPADRGSPRRTVPAPAPIPAPEEPPVEVPSTVIDLSDTDAGSAMFGAETVLAPGVTDDRCIQVTYAGDVDPGPVRLYVAAATGELAPYLDLTIEIGKAPAGAFGDCSTFTGAGRLYSGTLADFAAVHGGYFDGVESWDPSAGGEVRTFRFVVSVQDSPAAEGKSSGFGFTWEIRDRS